MISVDICRDPVAWDRYVESRPDSYNYHRWRWKGAIEETFNHAGYYLAATDAAGQIRQTARVGHDQCQTLAHGA